MQKKQKKNISQQKKSPQNNISEKTKSPIRIFAILLASIAFVLYINTIVYDYVYDDASVITENYIVKKGFAGIPTLLKTSYRYGYWNDEGNMYRPLSLIMFAIEWQLFPNTPAIGHLINILLYALTAYLLFITLVKLFHNYNILLPFLCTLFFIAHPLHTEVVANIKSRDEILAFLFAILSIFYLLNYIKNNSLRQLIYSFISFFAAFMSKENTITMVFIIFIILYFFTELPLKKNIILTTCYGFISFLFILIRASVLGAKDIKGGGAISPYDNMLAGINNLNEYLATAIMLLGKYFKILIFPHPLSCDYSIKQIAVVNFSNYEVLVSLFVYIIIIFLGVYFIKRKPIISFAIAFYLISISLYSNILILIGTHFGERLLYVPLLGFTLCLAYLILTAFSIPIEKNSYITEVSVLIKKYSKPLILSGIIVLLYSIKTVSRNTAWKDNYTLYATDVKTCPNSARLQYQYGLELMKTKALNSKDTTEKNNYLRQSIEQFNKALQLYPSHSEAYSEIALAYYRLKDFQQAVKYYDIALKMNPYKAETYSNLGAIYFETQQWQKALEVYQRAVTYNPRFADGYMNLGSTYGTIGNYHAAIAAFRKCLEYKPEAAIVYKFLGITYQKINMNDSALYYLNIAKNMGVQ